MKRIMTILALLLLAAAGFSQTLGNPQTIGQNSRNQKVGKGFQIEDTLLAKGIVRFSTLPTATAADTFVNVSNTAGQLSKVGKSTFMGGIGVGVSLSTITAATAANTINNGDKTQTWTWNSISGQSGLKLSSTANGTTSNKTQKLFESVLTGAMFNSSNSSYAGYFDNQQTNGGAYGIYARGATAGKFDGSVVISNSLIVSGTELKLLSGHTYLTPVGIFLLQGNSFRLQGSNLGLSVLSANTKQMLGFNCTSPASGSSDIYNGTGTNAASIIRDVDKLNFNFNTGLTNDQIITPKTIMTVYGTNSNVGIGTTSPDVSAKLDVSSTTQGFAPPEMTATQASAISTTSRKLIIYVTDTNGTFTSAGLWMWTGTTWKLILAE